MNFYNEFTKQWRSHFTRDEVPHVNCLKADQFKNVPDQMEALKRAERDVNTNVAVLQEKLSKQIFLRDHLVKYREKLSAIAAVLQQMDGSVVGLAFPECGGGDQEEANGPSGAGQSSEHTVGSNGSDSGTVGKVGSISDPHQQRQHQARQGTPQQQPTHAFKTESSDDYHSYDGTIPPVSIAPVLNNLNSMAESNTTCPPNCTAACSVNCTSGCVASCAATCAASCGANFTAGSGPVLSTRHSSGINVTAPSSATSSSSSSSSTSSGCGPMAEAPGPACPPTPGPAAAAAMMLDEACPAPPTHPQTQSTQQQPAATPPTSTNASCHPPAPQLPPLPPLPPHSMNHSSAGPDFGQPLPPLPPPMPPHSVSAALNGHPSGLPPPPAVSLSNSIDYKPSALKCELGGSSHHLPNFMAAALASAAAAAAAGGAGSGGANSGGEVKPPMSHGNFLFPKRRRYFACQVCGKRYSSKAAALIHMRTHTGERPFVCNECGRAFRQKAQLIQHERIHSGEKPYMCEVCEKSFRQKSHLDQHMHTHLTVKPFYCDKCGKAFRRKRGLLAHQERQICEGRVNDLSGLIEEVVPVECPGPPPSVLCPTSLPSASDLADCGLASKEDAAFLLGD